MTDKTIVEHKRFLFQSLRESGISEMDFENIKVTDTSRVIQAGRKHGKWGHQRAVVVYRQLLRFIKKLGHTLPIDWRDVEVPSVKMNPIDYLDKEELLHFINTIDINDRAHSGLRMRAIIEIIICTGLRIAELCSLDRSDINWEKKEAEVINCKTDQLQKIYFSDRALEWLALYLSYRKDKDLALFISGRSRLLPQTSRGWLRTHARNIGFRKRITHRIFRSTFATLLLRDGVDIKTVQDLCRHASERTTLRHYTAISKEHSKVEHGRVMNNLLT